MRERIRTLAAALNISLRRFSLSINKSESFARTIKNSVGADVVGEISRTYPNVNLNWLITGEGPMFKDDQNNDDGNITTSQLDILVKTAYHLSESEKISGDNIRVMNENMKELIAQGKQQTENITKLVDLLCNNGVEVVAKKGASENKNKDADGKSYTSRTG